MSSSEAKAYARSRLRLATARTSPFLDALMAGITAARPMFAVLSIPHRSFPSGMAHSPFRRRSDILGPREHASHRHSALRSPSVRRALADSRAALSHLSPRLRLSPERLDRGPRDPDGARADRSAVELDPLERHLGVRALSASRGTLRTGRRTQACSHRDPDPVVPLHDAERRPPRHPLHLGAVDFREPPRAAVHPRGVAGPRLSHPR